ncbi:MAG: glycerol-3-phosphate 1-O-acyltransferase PlsY [Bilifractor sp.]
MFARACCLLIGYGFGLFQTSYFIGRARGVDIRKMGSGNAGTTNALRTLGTKAGLLTMAGDVSKCILAVILTWLLFRGSSPELFPLLKIWTAAGVILGHDYPCYMKFKGGKGIAATAGMVIAFGDWPMIVVGIIVFFGLFFATHYVSLSSLSLSTEFLVFVCIFSAAGRYPMTRARLVEMCVIVAILTGLAFFQHRGNIRRLASGCERKTYLSSRHPSDP